MLSRRQLCLSIGLGLATRHWLWGDEVGTAALANAVKTWQELAAQGQVFEHWTPEQDEHWEWYRLERYIAEKWETVGIALPIHRESGEPYDPADGYLDRSRIPSYVLQGTLPELPDAIQQHMPPSLFDPQFDEPRVADPEVKARDGRPPSDWLVSLNAAELRSWLSSVEIPEAGVSGMTCWVHLVRDHSFDPRKIEGLTLDELTRLHSAAHFGY